MEEVTPKKKDRKRARKSSVSAPAPAEVTPQAEVQAEAPKLPRRHGHVRAPKEKVERPPPPPPPPKPKPKPQPQPQPKAQPKAAVKVKAPAVTPKATKEREVSRPAEGLKSKRPKQVAKDLKHLTPWPALRLSEEQGRSSSLPPLFSSDGAFCFVAAGSTVRVYSVSSSQLVSTLKPPTLAPVPVAPPNDEDGQDQVADTEEAAPAPAPAPVEDPKSEEGAQQDSAASPSKPGRKRNRHGPSKAIPVDYHQRDQSQTITALYINPLNTLQLITTSLDGFIRAWDFLEGKLMRSIDMKWPITAACTVEDAPASVADEGEMEGTSDEKPTHNYIFVTLEEPQKAWDVAPGVTRTVYMVPLEQPSRQLIKTKLGRGKDIFAMTLNSKRDLLIAISRYRIFIFFLPGSPLYGVKLGSVISFGAFNTNNQKNYDEGSFTSLAAHPTEDCFATGEDTGRIRVWYILETSFLQRLTNAIRTASRDTPDPSLIPQGAASILHWHAHAVTAVRFTPNGAYLLSGGEEATLVLWHMASTTGHKEFIPRLGAPINAITVTVGPTREQEFAARLRDGTVSFVGAGTLKVVRSLATVKTVLSQSQKNYRGERRTEVPFAVESSTQNLVFQASHPSSIQFFSPLLNNHVYELDVAPSNRVSSTDERPIEPVRVQQIAFAEAGHGGECWMATFDTWQDRDYQRESHLKVWIGSSANADQQSKGGYTLNTRVDNPHGGQTLSSLTFAPPAAASSSRGSSPTLVTTSEDGTIKIWSHRPSDGTHVLASGVWQCKFDLSYRGLEAFSSTVSPDGSLLAVGHHSCVSLWDLSTGTLVKDLYFRLPGRRTVRHVSFLDDGMKIVAATSQGCIVWDIITCEEIARAEEPISALMVPPGSGATSFAMTSGSDLTRFVLPSSSSSTSGGPSILASEDHRLPFAPAKILHYSTSSADLATSPPSDIYAALSSTGEVLLTSPSLAVLNAGMSSIAAGARATNLQALAATQAAETVVGGARPIRLFDELFADPSDAVKSTGKSRRAGGGAATTPSVYAYHKGKGTDVFDENPTHTLPPITSFWRGLVEGYLKPLPPAAAVGQPGVNDGEEDGMDIDESPDRGGRAVASDTKDFVDSPSTLADIFAKTFNMTGVAGGEASGTTNAMNASPSSTSTPGKKDTRKAGGTPGAVDHTRSTAKDSSRGSTSSATKHSSASKKQQQQQQQSRRKSMG